MSFVDSWNDGPAAEMISSLLENWRAELAALGDVKLVGRSAHSVVVKAASNDLKAAVDWVASQEVRI